MGGGWRMRCPAFSGQSAYFADSWANVRCAFFVISDSGSGSDWGDLGGMFRRRAETRERRLDIQKRVSPRGAKKQHDRPMLDQSLSNGARIIVVPTGAPSPGSRGVVSLQLWVSAGAGAERIGEFGCAHLLEHMIFKPTDESTTDDLASLLEGLGGDVNAFTSHDETVYHATVPADDAGVAVKTLLGAVMDPKLDATLLAREREVVLEEIRQYEDDTSSYCSQELLSKLFSGHSYGRAVLGSELDVQGIDRRRLASFHRRNYRGGNLTLVVIGPVDSRAIFAQAKPRLSATPPLARAGRPELVESDPSLATSPSVRVECRDVAETHLRIGWQGPGALSPDAVALDVASVILGQGESSRLAIEVRRGRRLVADAYAGFVGNRRAGSFVISAECQSGDVLEACDAIFEQMERLGTRPMEREELERARTLLESSLVYRRETVQGRGHALGYCAALSPKPGNEVEQAFFRHLSAASPGGVRAVCAQWLRLSATAMHVIVPRDEVSATEARELRDQLKACLKDRMKQARTRTRAAGKRSGATAIGGDGIDRDKQGTWHARLPCGLRVVGREDSSVPIVAGWMVWDGGSRMETKASAGTSHLASALLTRGTKRQEGDELARELDGIAATIGGFCGQNSVGLQLEGLSQQLPLLLDRTLECVRTPRFCTDEFKEERRVALADIAAESDELGQVAYRAMLSQAYGAHPYGRDVRGSASQLRALTADALRRFWSRRYPIGSAVLALAGDFQFGEVVEQLRARLEDVSVGAPTAPTATSAPSAPKWPRRARETLLRREREQGHIVIGFPGLVIGDPRCATLDVLTAVLGGQAGRLFTRLREQEGLVYQVSCSSSEGICAGHVLFYAAASQEKVDAARCAIEQEIRRVVVSGIDRAELERAQKWLIGHYETGMQRRARVASRLAFGEVYGLGSHHYFLYPTGVKRVSVGQVRALAEDLFRPQQQVTSIVRC